MVNDNVSTITSTPHQINKPPTSYERSNLFLLFLKIDFEECIFLLPLVD
jgi:hypothetical protein